MTHAGAAVVGTQRRETIPESGGSTPPTRSSKYNPRLRGGACPVCGLGNYAWAIVIAMLAAHQLWPKAPRWPHRRHVAVRCYECGHRITIWHALSRDLVECV